MLNHIEELNSVMYEYITLGIICLIGAFFIWFLWDRTIKPNQDLRLYSILFKVGIALSVCISIMIFYYSYEKRVQLKDHIYVSHYKVKNKHPLEPIEEEQYLHFIETLSEEEFKEWEAEYLTILQSKTKNVKEQQNADLVWILLIIFGIFMFTQRD